MARRASVVNNAQDWLPLIIKDKSLAEHLNPKSLTEIVLEDTVLNQHLSPQIIINNAPDYNITQETLRTLFSKVTTEGMGYTTLHKDHFELSRKIYNGVHFIEHNNFGNFTGKYGIPHEMMISLTPSELLSLYGSLAEIKMKYSKNESLEEGFNKFDKSKFAEDVGRSIESGRKYNAVRVMRCKENKQKNVPSLNTRLSKISQKARNEFYYALAQYPQEVRQPVRDDESYIKNFKGDFNRYYYYGIDAYVGKLISIFHQLYLIKTADKK